MSPGGVGHCVACLVPTWAVGKQRGAEPRAVSAPGPETQGGGGASVRCCPALALVRLPEGRPLPLLVPGRLWPPEAPGRLGGPQWACRGPQWGAARGPFLAPGPWAGAPDAVGVCPSSVRQGPLPSSLDLRVTSSGLALWLIHLSVLTSRATPAFGVGEGFVEWWCCLPAGPAAAGSQDCSSRDEGRVGAGVPLGSPSPLPCAPECSQDSGHRLLPGPRRVRHGLWPQCEVWAWHHPRGVKPVRVSSQGTPWGGAPRRPRCPVSRLPGISLLWPRPAGLGRWAAHPHTL